MRENIEHITSTKIDSQPPFGVCLKMSNSIRSQIGQYGDRVSRSYGRAHYSPHGIEYNKKTHSFYVPETSFLNTPVDAIKFEVDDSEYHFKHTLFGLYITHYVIFNHLVNPSNIGLLRYSDALKGLAKEVFSETTHRQLFIPSYTVGNKPIDKLSHIENTRRELANV